MTSLYSMGPWFCLVLYFIDLFLATFTASGILRCLIYSKKLWLNIFSIVLFVIEAVYFLLLRISYQSFEGETNALADMPFIVPVLILCLTLILNVVLFVLVFKTRKNTINERSIKSAVDDSLFGIMVFLENGIILLVNQKMNDIISFMQVRRVINAKQFYQTILSRKIESEDQNILCLNEKYYLFRLNKIKLENQHAYELMAMDVTEQYLIKQKTIEESDYLQKYNQSLHNYHENIVKVTTEQEILDAKIKIHDKLGELLLLSKDISKDTPLTDKENLIVLWKQIYSQLKNDTFEEENGNEYLDDLIAAGRSIGVELVMEESLPQHPIVNTFLHECLTNTYKHGHGTRMEVSSHMEKDYYVITSVNNGQSEEEIVFKGGLKSLEELVEKNGGTLSCPKGKKFCLEMRLPKGVIEQWKNRKS